MRQRVDPTAHGTHELACDDQRQAAARGLGAVAAALAVLPAILAPGTQLPWGSLALTLAAILLNGLLSTWLATTYSLRGNLLAALRNE